MLSRELSRRDLLRDGWCGVKTAVLLPVVAPILAACTPNPDGTNPGKTLKPNTSTSNPTTEFGRNTGIYTGPIPAMEGKPFLEEKRLNKILDALDHTPVPLFRKVAREVRRFTSTRQVPPEFPNWIDPNSFPFPITADQLAISTLNMRSEVSSDPDEAFLLKFGNDMQEKDYLVKSMLLGINLGLPSTVTDRGSLLEGLFLVKEWLSMELQIKLAMELFDLAPELGAQVTDLKGENILDKQTQSRIGATILISQLKDQSNRIAQVTDAFPIYLVAMFMPYLIQQKLIDNSVSGIPELVLASNQVNDNNPQLSSALAEIIALWTNQNRLLPPDGISRKVFNAPIASSALALAEKFTITTRKK